MSDLQFHFERLLDFAREFNVSIKPNTEIYFFYIRSANYQENPVRIQKELLIPFSDFEKDFDELLNQGHSWINLSLVGYLETIFLIEFDYPQYENNCPRDKIFVNLSLQNRDNNFDCSKNFKII